MFKSRSVSLAGEFKKCYHLVSQFLVSALKRRMYWGHCGGATQLKPSWSHYGDSPLFKNVVVFIEIADARRQRINCSPNFVMVEFSECLKIPCDIKVGLSFCCLNASMCNLNITMYGLDAYGEIRGDKYTSVHVALYHCLSP